MTTKVERLPRLTKMQVQKYYQMRTLAAELSKLAATMKDLHERRQRLSAELEVAFGEHSVMRVNGGTLLERREICVEGGMIERAGYVYTKWTEKRG